MKNKYISLVLTSALFTGFTFLFAAPAQAAWCYPQPSGPPFESSACPSGSIEGPDPTLPPVATYWCYPQPSGPPFESSACPSGSIEGPDPTLPPVASPTGSKTLDVGDKGCDPPTGTPLDRTNCAIIGHLITGINVLSAIAGMAIIFSIMFAGYQYMTARDNAGTVQQARQRIIWALSALLIFIFMYALLDFLVPGGVLP